MTIIGDSAEGLMCPLQSVNSLAWAQDLLV